MPGALDSLKSYVFGKPKGKDIDLPIQPGKKRDPRLPKESSVREGFRLMQDTLKEKK